MKPQAGIVTRLLGISLVAAGMSGCSSGSIDMMFVNPGSFDYLSCADLANTTNATLKRQQELKELIDRAERDTGGSLVAATAYRTDYLKAQGELKLLAAAAQNKNCEPPKS